MSGTELFARSPACPHPSPLVAEHSLDSLARTRALLKMQADHADTDAIDYSDLEAK